MKASENETQGLGDRIGHLDTTTGPSPESPYKPKVWTPSTANVRWWTPILP